MSKTVTLRLNESIYNMFRNLAVSENRTLSNFIETSVLRFIEHNQFVDEYEMTVIKNNKGLNASLNRAIKDVKAKKGRFVDWLPYFWNRRIYKKTQQVKPERQVLYSKQIDRLRLSSTKAVTMVWEQYQEIKRIWPWNMAVQNRKIQTVLYYWW